MKLPRLLQVSLCLTWLSGLMAHDADGQLVTEASSGSWFEHTDSNNNLDELESVSNLSVVQPVDDNDDESTSPQTRRDETQIHEWIDTCREAFQCRFQVELALTQHYGEMTLDHLAAILRQMFFDSYVADRLASFNVESIIQEDSDRFRAIFAFVIKNPTFDIDLKMVAGLIHELSQHSLTTMDVAIRDIRIEQLKSIVKIEEPKSNIYLLTTIVTSGTIGCILLMICCVIMITTRNRAPANGRGSRLRHPEGSVFDVERQLEHFKTVNNLITMVHEECKKKQQVPKNPNPIRSSIRRLSESVRGSIRQKRSHGRRPKAAAQAAPPNAVSRVFTVTWADSQDKDLCRIHHVQRHGRAKSESDAYRTTRRLSSPKCQTPSSIVRPEELPSNLDQNATVDRDQEDTVRPGNEEPVCSDKIEATCSGQEQSVQEEAGAPLCSGGGDA